MSVPLNSACAILMVKASRDGRCKPAYSMAIPGEPARDLTAERNRVPFPTGPGVTFADRTMCGLQAGSFRWPATKPKTTSAGAPVTISIMAATARPTRKEPRSATNGHEETGHGRRARSRFPPGKARVAHNAATGSFR